MWPPSSWVSFVDIGVWILCPRLCFSCHPLLPSFSPFLLFFFSFLHLHLFFLCVWIGFWDRIACSLSWFLTCYVAKVGLCFLNRKSIQYLLILFVLYYICFLLWGGTHTLMPWSHWLKSADNSQQLIFYSLPTMRVPGWSSGHQIW